MTAAKPVAEIEHGTYGGYQQCVKRAEKSCPDCRAANRVYIADYRKRRPVVGTEVYAKRRARDRALRKLARKHPVTFQRLYEAELGRLQQGDTP